ncbi:MAG: efflux RND transporter periplasmic adaptor subunit [Rhodoblastus sp.]|uniref:efflux RND transporter periplasmic adaptor subunit n=1 Tax=Rhodoblastus sp. TaxID=1962975 RepID=UPI003F9E8D51
MNEDMANEGLAHENTAHRDTTSARPIAPVRRRRIGLWLIPLALAILAGYVAFALMQRRESQTDLAAWTRDRAVPYVAVIHPHSDANPQVLALPGNISAWYEASIHSQVAGYIKSWSKDIGAHVKKGDVLAEIDTPELDERLAQAREELSRAQANLSLAKVTAERWAALRSSSAVSKQSSDEKASDEKVKQADVGAASANLDRLKAQKVFALIVAPFDGVVTARNIDIGSYVAPDRNSEAMFKVADIHEVRIYVNVPQIYSARLKPGMKATFTTPQMPGRVFTTTIATTSNAIGAQTGSLLVELDMPNVDGALYPGSYADVHFELPVDASQLRIASSALSIGERGTRVAIVDADDRVTFKTVTIAKDFGSEVAIAGGLAPEDRVIDNPAETLTDGDQVRIAGAKSPSASE